MNKANTGQKVLLKSSGLSLKEIYGSVKPIKKSFAQMRLIAKQERLRKYKRFILTTGILTD